MQDGTQGATKSGNIWTVTTKIPYNTTYSIAATGLTGYDDPTTISNITSNQITRTVNLEFTERVVVENGVYAYYSNGTILPYSQATTSAIGVAVVDNDAMFVIDKTNVDSAKQFGGYNLDLSSTNIVMSTDSTVAKTDFDGYMNTTKLISACAGYTDSSYSITGAPAAEACRQQFSGKGYLPALGEWNVAYKYKTDIDAMLTDKIGGTKLTNDYYWSSTLYNESTNSWMLNWRDGDDLSYNRSTNHNVRAFAALNTSLTLTLVSQDTSGVSGLSVTVTDRTGTSQTLTSDSNGKVTVSSVACGQVNVTIAGRVILNAGDTFTVNRNSATQRVTLNMATTGVYAYYSNGALKTYSDADSTAIGVAVVYDDATFVIGKNTTQLAFGGYNTVNLTGTAMVTTDSTSAKTDFDGYRNTSRIMNALKNQAGNGSGSYPATTGAPAAEWCRTQFSGEGYLPSLGEMNFAYQHKTDIDAMMTAIGGTAMGTSYSHWTSTHYNTTQYSWLLNWSSGYAGNDYRYYNYDYVRAFQALKTSITLNLSATDSSSISGQTVLVSDKLGNVQTAVSDSNGQVTFSNVACGQVFVSVKKCLVNSNRTIKVSPINKVFTIGFSTPNVGLYYYSLDANGNGVLSPSSATNAIGVAVVTSNCAFVIDKNDLSRVKGGSGIAWGGYNVDLSNIGVMVTDNSTTAKTDFSGEENTAKVINALYQVKGAEYSSWPATYGAPALETCTTAFNGKGYMPSAGEWNAAYSNYYTIDSMMSNISGSAAISVIGDYWTSTMYNNNNATWFLNWGNGTITTIYRCVNSYQVRAFSAL